MRRRFHRVLASVLLSVTATAAAGDSNAQPRSPVPEGAALEASQKAAADLYGDRFRSAKTLADKTAVAADMTEAALQLQDGSADQYVLLRIAREIAAGAGDAATALRAAEKQAERFDLPAAKLKAETLLTAAREAATTAQHKAVAEATLPVIGNLTDADEIELARDVCEAGRAAAAKSRQFALVKELAAKADDVKQQQASSAEYRRAVAVMENDPAEPAANLAAGRYLCLVKGDWVKGVPMLALGSDATLKAVALMELRGAESAEQQAAIGDAWWDAAEARQGAERDTLRLRAGAWYRKAEPKLAGGLAGLKIKQRLSEIAKLGPTMLLPPQPSSRSPDAPTTASPVKLAITKGKPMQFTSVTSGLAFSPDGKLLVVGGLEKAAAVIDVGSMRVVRTLAGHEDFIRAVAFSPDGQLVATGDFGGDVKLWNAVNGQSVRAMRGHTDKIFDIAFSPNGRLLATASNDTSLRLWDVSTGREQAVLRGHESWVWTLAFSPDGKWLASAGGIDKTARVWDVASGKPINVLAGHGGKVRTVRFLPGGETLITSCDDRTVRFWDRRNAQQKRSLTDQQGLFSADVSPDGRILVTSGGGIVKFWDIASLRHLHTEQTETQEVYWGLRFSPTGGQVALGGDTKTLQLWTLNASQ